MWHHSKWFIKAHLKSEITALHYSNLNTNLTEFLEFLQCYFKANIISSLTSTYMYSRQAKAMQQIEIN